MKVKKLNIKISFFRVFSFLSYASGCFEIHSQIYSLSIPTRERRALQSTFYDITYVRCVRA